MFLKEEIFVFVPSLFYTLDRFSLFLPFNASFSAIYHIGATAISSWSYGNTIELWLYQAVASAIPCWSYGNIKLELRQYYRAMAVPSCSFSYTI